MARLVLESGFDRFDSQCMRRALLLAERGAGQVSPNPLVGAVIAKDGKVVSEGWHARFGGAHAEVVALEKAAENSKGATLYVSLEPCNHHGKTPPCSEAIIKAGISRVVYSVADPGQLSSGGAKKLETAGIKVQRGLLDAQGKELVAAFLNSSRATPWLTLKLALSLDGALVDGSRQRAWITGSRSLAAVQKLRRLNDAVGVGIGTALSDDPLLTVRTNPAPRRPPLRVVFDRSARLPLTSKLISSINEQPLALITSVQSKDREESLRRELLEKAGAVLVQSDSLLEGLSKVKTLGVQSILVEGGAAIASALYHAGLVDRLIIFRGPIVLGQNALSAFGQMPAVTVSEAPRLNLLRNKVLGSDIMTEYAVTEM